MEKLLCFLGVGAVGIFEDKRFSYSEAGGRALLSLYHHEIRLLAYSLNNLSHGFGLYLEFSHSLEYIG